MFRASRRACSRSSDFMLAVSSSTTVFVAAHPGSTPVAHGMEGNTSLVGPQSAPLSQAAMTQAASKTIADGGAPLVILDQPNSSMASAFPLASAPEIDCAVGLSTDSMAAEITATG